VYVAKLIKSREGFCNVNQVAFPAEEKTAKCECSKQQWLDVPDVSIFVVISLQETYELVTLV
jgi:hypothetical protein